MIAARVVGIAYMHPSRCKRSLRPGYRSCCYGPVEEEVVVVVSDGTVVAVAGDDDGGEMQEERRSGVAGGPWPAKGVPRRSSECSAMYKYRKTSMADGKNGLTVGDEGHDIASGSHPQERERKPVGRQDL